MKAASGRSTERCVCSNCGRANYFYLWSWAGNGAAKCKSCGARISYYTREATPTPRRCVLAARHKGDHVFPTRKPILDRMQDGEFRGRTMEVPGVSVPGNRPRCDTRQPA